MLVHTGQFYTLFPGGGVVWKIPYSICPLPIEGKLFEKCVVFFSYTFSPHPFYFPSLSPSKKSCLFHISFFEPPPPLCVHPCTSLNQK